jgi:ankyrin repeat protein
MNETAKSITRRGLAFASTLMLSLVMMNALPSVKQRRQRYFSEAAMDGSLRRMQLLRLAGAKVNARGNCCLPLFIAAGEGRLEIVRYLLDQNADVNAPENFGNTALSEAVYNNHSAVAKELLFRGAEVNAVGEGGTALDIALARGFGDIADLLRHHGARRLCEMRHGDCHD